MKKSVVWILLRMILTLLLALFMSLVLMKAIPYSFPSLISLFIAFATVTVISILIAFNKERLRSILKLEMAENRFEALHLFLPPFLLVGLFAVICNQLYKMDSGLFIVNSSHLVSQVYQEDTELWFILFSLDNLSRVLFFDLLETFRISFVNIMYTTNFWLMAFVFVFKCILSVVFLRFLYALVITYKQQIKQSWDFP